MAEMATIPVFKCRRCGKPVYVTKLSSVNDPTAEKLKSLMQNLQKIAVCGDCRRIYNWLAKQGRTNEFLINPHVVILSVIDKSDADYYGRKMK